MTKHSPPEFKSKAAFLDWTLLRADDLASDLRRKSAHHPEADLRLSMATLLQCADFVFQLSEAGHETTTPKTHNPEYVQLDVGHLRTKGYLSDHHEEGLLSLWRRKVLLPFSIDEAEGNDSYTLMIGPPRQKQRIQVTATHPSFGGRRFWLVCPGLGKECGGRFLRLYRALDGGPFACRECHKAAHDAGWRSARDRKVLQSTIQRAS